VSKHGPTRADLDAMACQCRQARPPLFRVIGSEIRLPQPPCTAFEVSLQLDCQQAFHFTFEPSQFSLLAAHVATALTAGLRPSPHAPQAPPLSP